MSYDQNDYSLDRTVRASSGRSTGIRRDVLAKPYEQPLSSSRGLDTWKRG